MKSGNIMAEAVRLTEPHTIAAVKIVHDSLRAFLDIGITPTHLHFAAAVRTEQEP